MSAINYTSNNSGGDWWLKDEHWRALEEAGWNVQWHKDSPEYLKLIDAEGRWLRSLATRASRDGLSVKDAVTEWERITGQDACDEGCGCCGPPHSFSWTNDDGTRDYASGEDCVRILYGNDTPATLREAVALLKKGNAQ